MSDQLKGCPICTSQPTYKGRRYSCRHKGTPYEGVFDPVHVDPYTEEPASRLLWNTLGELSGDTTERKRPVKYQVWLNNGGETFQEMGGAGAGYVYGGMRARCEAERVAEWNRKRYPHLKIEIREVPL